MAKEKIYNLYAKATDREGNVHYITVVGKCTQEDTTYTIPTETFVTDENGRQHRATIFTDYKAKTRTFTMAKAICDPRDEFNEEYGKKLALKRLERGEVIGTQTSNDITMLNDDQCEMLVVVELAHIIRNIDSYIGLNKSV